MGAPVGAVTSRERDGRGYTLNIDGGWWVAVNRMDGEPAIGSDRGFPRSVHAEHRIETQPTSEQIDAPGRDLVAKVLPDFDIAEMESWFTMVPPRSADVGA
ncbi:MAG TPA: hypothetical protein PLQ54_15305 [Armatimonadota bacterium]|nr:hypothetical protein [Armatimonadota bacterium]